MLKKMTLAAALVCLVAASVDAKPFKKVAGQDFPAVKVTDLMTGKAIDLAAELKKDSIKGAVITFTCIGCPVAVAYEERQKELVSKYGEEFVFIFLNSNMGSETPEAWKDYAAEAKYPGIVAADTDSSIAKAIGATVTPEVYVVDKKGKVAFHGPVDDSQDVQYIESHLLANALEAIRTGKEIPADQREVQAFGCGIKLAKSE